MHDGSEGETSFGVVVVISVRTGNVKILDLLSFTVLLEFHFKPKNVLAFKGLLENTKENSESTIPVFI